MLYQKARPQTLDEVVGNEAVVSTLKGVIQSEDRPHSYLFYGPTGTGKTTLARILGREIGGKDVTIQETNAASVRGIDHIRHLEEQAAHPPLFGGARVVIFDEAHQLSKDAQNCLLKLLEDTPEYQYYILCSTDPSKIIPTIRSRCATFETKPLQIKELEKIIQNAWARVFGAPAPEALTKAAAELADGCPRKALINAENLANCGDEKDYKKVLKNLQDTWNSGIDLARKLVNGRWNEVSTILQDLESEPEYYRVVVANYLAACLRKARSFSEIEKFVLALSVLTDYGTYLPNDKARLTRAIAEAWLHLRRK